MNDTSATATGPHKPEIKPPYVLKFNQPDPTELRRRLLAQWDDLANESGAKPEAGGLDRFEGLAIAGDFSFLLAAILRRAEQYEAMDHTVEEPEPFVDWLARTIGLVLDTGLDWLEGANDDLLHDDEPAADEAETEPQPQIEGQGVLPVETAGSAT